MTERDDEALLRLFATTRSDQAFSALVERYASLVYTVCLTRLRRPELAEDASQAVFILLAERAGRIEVRTSLVGWLYATSKLVCKATWREERKRMSREVPLDEHRAAPAAVATDLDLHRAIARLPSDQREAVVLRFFQGLDLREVGRVQGISEDAARMRVQRALNRMRPALAGHGDDFSTLAAPAGLLALQLPTASLHAQSLANATKILMTTTTIKSIAAVAVCLAIGGVVSARIVGSQPSATSQTLPKIATLDKPFTLVYKTTFIDVRTQAMKDADYAALKKERQSDVDADRRSQVDVDKELAEASKPKPPMTKQITLSYDGHTLLFDEPSSGAKNDLPNLGLFDGNYSYHFTPGLQNQSNAGQRMPGTISYYTFNMPYIGPSLPLFPLTKDEKVLCLFAWDTKLVYIAGKLESGKGNSAAQIGLVSDEVALSDYEELQGRFVARSIDVIRRDFGAFKGAPRTRIEYRLISAQPTALAQERFKPDSYVKDGEDFNYRVDAKDRDGHTFKLDSSKGSVSEQIAAEMKSGQ